MSERGGVNEATVAFARTLAERRPEATLPCPFCAAGVKGGRLAKHLKKVHGDEPTRAGASLTLDGIDRAVWPWTVAPLVLWGLVVFVIAWSGDVVADRIGHLLAFSLLVLIVPPLLAGLGRLRASLTLEGDDLRLRFGVGRLQRRIRLGGEVERGRLRERRTNAVTSSYAARHDSGLGETDVDAGFYLRFSGEGSAITVGCPKGTAFGKHWGPSGWARGETRRQWDITIDRAQMVALEYELARRSLIAPRREA